MSFEDHCSSTVQSIMNRSWRVEVAKKVIQEHLYFRIDLMRATSDRLTERQGHIEFLVAKVRSRDEELRTMAKLLTPVSPLPHLASLPQTASTQAAASEACNDMHKLIGKKLQKLGFSVE